MRVIVKTLFVLASLTFATGCATVREAVPRPAYGAAYDGLPEIAHLPNARSQGLSADARIALTLVPSANTVRFLQYLEGCREVKMKDSGDFLQSMLSDGSSPRVAKKQSFAERLLVHITENLRSRFGTVDSTDSFGEAMTRRLAGGAIAALDIVPSNVICNTVESSGTKSTYFVWGDMRVAATFVSPDAEIVCVAATDVSQKRSGIKYVWNEGKFLDSYLKWVADQLDGEVAKCIIP